MKQRYIFFIILSLLITAHLFANSFKAKNSSSSIKAYKVSSEVFIDGSLTESIWSKVPVRDFTQRDPDEGNPATERTEVWVAYDETNIYVAARLYDSNPSTIDASLARRDSWIDSDWFFFYVDPFFDKKTGYFFGVNPGGSLTDGVYFNDSWNDDSWDGIWQSAAKIDENGWTVELKIPFSQLRFSEAKEMKWGVNFRRDIKRNNEKSYFVMVPKDESGFVSHFATLEGINGVEPKQRLEILPYVVQRAQYLRHDESDPFYKGNQYRTTLGADMKIGLGSNLNLDATFNPDFGQVEVDPAVINLTAFETFFPEKRPFFIEGSNLFYFGIGGSNNNWGFNFGNPELFYSRRIGRSPQGYVNENGYVDYPNETRILGAAKLTGKLNESWSIGAVSAVTERTYARINNAGNVVSREIEPLTHYGVLRTKKEFNSGKQGIGLMVTGVTRDLSNQNLNSLITQHAYVAGIDGWTFLDDEEMYVINYYVAGSYSKGSKESIQRLQKQPYRYYQRPDASFAVYDTNRTSLSGLYSRVMFNKQKGNFYINSALGMVTPGFENNDLGYQWMADRINAHTVLGYRFYEQDNIFRRKYFYVAHARSINFEGKTTQNFIWFRNTLEFLNYYGIDIGGNYVFEVYSPTWTRGGPMLIKPAEWSIWASAMSDTREKIIGGVYGTYARDEIQGVFYNAGFDIEWKPNTQLTVSIGPEYTKNDEKRQWVGSFTDPFAAKTYGSRYVFGRILRETVSGNIRVNWTFTPELSLQLYLQPLFAVGHYNDFKELGEAGTKHFNDYGDNVSYDESNDTYSVDPDGSGPAQAFSFGNPDFNFKSLRANLILRWEVMPGSVFYFAWTHDQTNFDDPGSLAINRDLRNLWNAEADDVLLVKFSYWLDM
ncbi:MAG: carbohydrate binding family 9 domain-containing protein [Melioribacteraceae bacterium]|nr:carbohydrate binding family 9 domain-containing protein [Melioribacteraceae bacterium]MCF8356056.1 carbohydrate binding family 9 domain-containing protein [Melioribacteraceae bacterium]MCF8394883.1 carbohydrate binding family 9 domain-containing protein [Melioribacteraceae bacterium]MCF8420416.1 carbohydrate binding family 9 domain-containing protein [Melioribacteraceae bacterium]